MRFKDAKVATVAIAPNEEEEGAKEENDVGGQPAADGAEPAPEGAVPPDAADETEE